MDELIAFLRARLDEDEAAAAVASDGPWTAWRDPGLGLRYLDYAVALPGQDSGSPVSIATASWMDAEHIARHDPARVLREVAAKRAIVAGYDDAISGALEYGTVNAWEEALYHLAAVWSGHPDYRPEWKP